MLSSSFADSNSLGAGGPKPNFALNFITETLDSRVTFSRTSHATRFNSSGVLEFAPNNVIRNNTMQGAVAGTPGTMPTYWTSSTTVDNLTREVVGSGVLNGINYVDIKWSGTTGTAGNVTIVTCENNAFVAALNGQTWSGSVYLALIGGTITNVSSINLSVRYNDGTGAILTSQNLPVSLTSNLVRFDTSFTAADALTAFVNLTIVASFTNNSPVDFTLRIGLPQLELGSTARTAVQTSGTAYYGHRTDYDPSNVVRQNLLTYSEQFDNAAWLKNSSTVNFLSYSEQFDNAVWRIGNTGTVTANAAVAPFGSASTADLITAGNVLFGGLVARRTNVTYSASTQYTLSVYAKAGTHSYLGLRASGDCASLTGDEAYPYFNLSTGVATTVTPRAGTINSVNMENIGSGWYRCSVTFTTAATVSSNITDIAIVSSTGQTAVTPAGTENLYIWGAQLEIRSSAGPYISTTTTAATAPSCVIQTNQIRNNTMVDAVAGTPGTSPTNWSISPPVNLSYKIEAVGEENGISYIDLKISGTANAATSFGGIFFPDSLTLVPASSGQTWTASCYFKLVAGNFNNVTTLYWNCVERDGTGSSTGLTSSTNLTSITSAALDTQRITATRTFNSPLTSRTMASLTLGCSINAVIDFTIRVGMPQLVRGSVPGDIVATSGTALPVQYTSPFGTLTAEKLIEAETPSSSHLMYQTRTATNETVTYSVYAKAGERTKMFLQMSNFVNATAQVIFNLSNGTIFNQISSSADYTNISSSMTSVGNGWYLCILRATKGSVNTNNNLTISTVNPSDQTTYTGDGSSGIYIFGAQLNYGSSALQYYPTTTAAYTECQPRGLLIEETRTNSIRNNTMQGAVAGTPGTMPTNWTISTRAGITTQVVGVGTESGINYIDVKLSGTPDVGVTTHFLNYESSTQVTSAVGQTWNASAYYKLAGGSTAGFSAIYHVLSSRNASAGELSQTSVNFQSTISSASLVSQRIQCSLTTTSDLTAYVLPYLYFIYTGAPVDITIRIGMPQCENNNINTGVASATVSAGGSGYNVGDILEVVGGTGTKARLTVATLSGSAVATVTVSTVGSYSVFPTPQPVSVTAITGTGINATFNITPQTQTGISTSAIPTYSVGVQRNAENASITGTNFSSWYNSTAGTIYAEYSISTASQSGIVSLNDGTANNKMDIRPQTASSIGNTGGTLQWVLFTANPSVTTPNKFALAYAQDDIGAVLNNGTVQTDTSATIPTVTNLQLGGLDGSTTSFKPNGYLRRIAYYPRRLTNSELKTITS